MSPVALFRIGRIILSRSGVAPVGDSRFAVYEWPVVVATAKCGDMAGASDGCDGVSAVCVDR